ncbi:hypothetical protein OG799_10695 [Micromonospora sp. NBC_00898]|uniref:hypothetical protein n=1 Tax=Micromonospora sp. NBC_00898 TaxID=2975981 RepID=UPI0038677C36|nr:hypothetical protein OG799_10695 [Micromonospora sp. NBC_00898]
MKKRYVARVPMPGQPGRGRSRTDGATVARGTATPPGADTAAGPDVGVAAVRAAVPPGDASPQPPLSTMPAAGPGATPAPLAVAPAPTGRARGVATPPEAPDAGGGVDGATQMFQAPDVTAAIFVDHSGRRGRTLRRVVSALALFALLLIVALWVSQGAEVLGLRVAA